MIRVLLATFAVLAAALAVLCILLRRALRRSRELANQLAAVLDTNQELMRQVGRLRQQACITAENRRKADGEIEALHSGDALGNALDGLSARKG